jgi:hypothetical protein
VHAFAWQVLSYIGGDVAFSLQTYYAHIEEDEVHGFKLGSVDIFYPRGQTFSFPGL